MQAIRCAGFAEAEAARVEAEAVKEKWLQRQIVTDQNRFLDRVGEVVKADAVASVLAWLTDRGAVRPSPSGADLLHHEDMDAGQQSLLAGLYRNAFDHEVRPRPELNGTIPAAQAGCRHPRRCLDNFLPGLG